MSFTVLDLFEHTLVLPAFEKHGFSQIHEFTQGRYFFVTRFENFTVDLSEVVVSHDGRVFKVARVTRGMNFYLSNLQHQLYFWIARGPR